MTREEKNQVIDELLETLTVQNAVYLADTTGLTVEASTNLRRICFAKNVQLKVVKNTLLKKAMEKSGKDFSPLYDVLHGTTAIMLSETANAPAKIIQEYLKANKKADKPSVKGAFIADECYVGGGNLLNDLANIKSREELIGEIVGLLQSPAKNVISALQSNAGGKIAGLVKTLETRNN